MDTKESFQLSSFNFSLIRVAIVDDHASVADGFERFINDSGIAGVIGKANSAAGCMKLLAQSEPDVLLLDVSLPDGNGIDLFLKINVLYPDLKVMILTSHTEMHIIKRAFDCGVSGFVLKNVTADVIIEGIQTVASGKRYFCNETNQLLEHRDDQTVVLSRREQELLRLIVAGKSNAEIAESMILGYETVKSYRKHLMFKLNTSNTAELVRVAIEQQLI